MITLEKNELTLLNRREDILMPGRYLNARPFSFHYKINDYKAKIAQQQIISMRKQENNIPRRERHWKKYSYLRINEEKVYYECECGKKYISFPALYLHFERKHHRKIKNLHNPNQFQVVSNGSQIIYRFLLKQGETQKCSPFSVPSQKKSNIVFESIFSEFQIQCKQKLSEFAQQKSIIKIFRKFLQFLKETQNEQLLKDQFESIKIISTLPYKFNEFILANKLRIKRRKTFQTYAIYQSNSQNG